MTVGNDDEAVDADAVLTTDSDADQSDTHAADEAPSAPVDRMDTLVLAARHTEAMEFHAKLADYRRKSSTPVASDHHNKSLTEVEVLVSYNLYEVPSDDQKGKLKKRKLVPETRLHLWGIFSGTQSTVILLVLSMLTCRAARVIVNSKPYLKNL